MIHDIREKVRRKGRPLKCPLCQFRFAYRHLSRGGCPKCKTPLGFSDHYRLALILVVLATWFFVLYRGYVTMGGAMLLLGWPIAFAAALIVKSVFLGLFPPKLEPYAGPSVWLKLH